MRKREKGKTDWYGTSAAILKRAHLVKFGWFGIRFDFDFGRFDLSRKQSQI